MANRGDIELEAQATERVLTLTVDLAEWAGPVWHIGDGRGGWVLDKISSALRAEGLIPANDTIEIDWRPTPRPAMLEVARRDGWECHYCSRALGWGAIDEMPTIDHQIPTSRSGTDDLDNLVLACVRCNARKNNKTADEYLIWRIRTVMAKRPLAA